MNSIKNSFFEGCFSLAKISISPFETNITSVNTFNSSVIHLQCLSYKYEYPELKRKLNIHKT